VLMGENEDNLYSLDDSLEVNTKLQPVNKDQLRDDNLTLSIFRYNAGISHLNAKIANTYFLPSLAFSGGYNYSHTSNSTGFALFSQSYGPNGTLTLSIPVFEGGNLRRQSKVASLQALRDDLLYEKQNTVIGRQYRTAWKNYEVAVVTYNLEHENIMYAKENLDVQIARFKVGVGTTLEARQAENDYVTALERLYTANYNLKVTETIVLELENQLVK
jgi:outer membrane protein